MKRTALASASVAAVLAGVGMAAPALANDDVAGAAWTIRRTS